MNGKGSANLGNGPKRCHQDQGHDPIQALYEAKMKTEKRYITKKKRRGFVIFL